MTIREYLDKYKNLDMHKVNKNAQGFLIYYVKKDPDGEVWRELFWTFDGNKFTLGETMTVEELQDAASVCEWYQQQPEGLR